MGPSTKKRKEPPPNRTLLDFFSNSDTIKRARVRTPQQFAPNVRQTNSRVSSREVIVIDSDSDDGLRGGENGERSVPQGCRVGASGDSQSLGSAALTPARPKDKDAFGVPSELLRTIDSCMETSNARFDTHEHSSIALKPARSESMFGVSAPLLEQPFEGTHLTEGSQPKVVGNDSVSIMARDHSAYNVPVEFSVGDWAAGDDELASLELTNNSSGVDEDGSDSTDEQRLCPVCGTDLAGYLVLEVQTHVNQCLDTTSQTDDFMQECTLATMPVEPVATSDNGGTGVHIKSQGDDLYTVLMKSHQESEAWVEVDAVADRDFRPTRGNRRKAPFYKILQGMPIAVDAFCYGTIPGVTAYFLTHAHSDHYTNLGTKWKSGPVYCSEETANLIVHMLAVDPKWLHPLPLDTPTIVPDTGGVRVTLIEANHCPGSCLFMFEGQQTVDAGDSAFKSSFIGSSRVFRYLHCGDFRASPRHILHPAVNGRHIDYVYLDTTYLDPKYMFSPQPLVISACAELARRLVVGGIGGDPGVRINWNPTIDAWMKSPTSVEAGGQPLLQGRTLVIIGTYSIGKERIVKAIAQALGAKIFCDSRKTAILRCQADKELHALLTADPAEADVHILPLGTVTSDNLRSYLQKFKGTFTRIIGFRPTGWTYSPPPGSTNSNASVRSIISHGQSRHFSYADLQPSQKSSHNIQIFGVPYSEHSSFFELTCFAMSCDWGRMIPTVNVGNPTSRAKMTKWLKRWELDKRCAKPSVVQPRTDDYW